MGDIRDHRVRVNNEHHIRIAQIQALSSFMGIRSLGSWIDWLSTDMDIVEPDDMVAGHVDGRDDECDDDR
jgi:hypothetical protein